MHHRTAEFKEVFSRTLADLKTFIGTSNDVLLLASSGSGAMEAAVANLTSPGEKVLVLSAGKFGERWRDLANAFHCQVEMVSVPYGETFDLREVQAKLAGARVLYMQATETSTGARHDVKAVASLLKGSDTLLVVDGITGLGTTHFEVDNWGIDILIGGSQKAVMIPPGLAYLSVSERAWQRMETAAQPRFYFDLRKERKSQGKGETAFTPAVALVCGLAAALDFIRKGGNGNLADGRDALIHNAETSAAMVRAGVQALGLGLFAPTCPAAAVTAVLAPKGVDSSAIVKEFRERFAMVVANGQGEMKGKLFRIAHLGYYDYLDAIGVIGALEHVLLKVAPNHKFEIGAGVRAVQETFAGQFAEVASV
jgi:aspartate aminotransferase-like enzyme